MGSDQGSPSCRLRDDGAGGGRGVAPGVGRHIVGGVGRRGGGVDDDLGFENGVDEDACLPRLSRYGGAAFRGVLGLLPVVVVVGSAAAGPASLPVVSFAHSTTLNPSRMLPLIKEA